MAVKIMLIRKSSSFSRTKSLDGKNNSVKYTTYSGNATTNKR